MQIRLYRKIGTVLARRSENETALEYLARGRALLADDAMVESAGLAVVYGTVLLALGQGSLGVAASAAKLR